ncbi:MAG TPA: BamA/TamA family outer membrane protein [Spirochaetales bacterium]|nr:BamA/TamA family outer membrane protein [Spirochaetales bacterium]
MKRALWFALVLCLAFMPVFAQESGKDFEFTFFGPRFYSFFPSGADFKLSYSGLDFGLDGNTELVLVAGGGYQEITFPRDPANGNTVLAEQFASFPSPNFQWDLGLVQGLARRPNGANLVELFLFYRGRLDLYNNDLSATVFADMQGLFGTSFLTGASFSTVSRSVHRLRSGLFVEGSAEWAPAFLNAKSDFWRVSGQARAYVPLFDLPNDGKNLLSMYIAAFLGADYADGASVPLYVQRSFGGRYLRGSLGDSIRGYAHSSFDTSFKLASSLELRLLGPALFLPSIVPFLYGFVDAGYLSGYWGTSRDATVSGSLASAGGAIGVDLFDFAQLHFIMGSRLIDDGVYGLQPGMFMRMGIFFHF